jgi:DNA polymerase-3 subunit gamma/tau
LKDPPVEEPLINKVAEVLVGPAPKVPPPQDGRQKATFNLSNIGKVTKTAEEVPVTKIDQRGPDKPIDAGVLRKAWDEFIALRRDQHAELAVLKREYVLSGTIITVSLVSDVEDMLIKNMKTSLITFLRDRTGSSSLMVEGKIIEIIQTDKKPYTNKDKFEHLAKKNPVLKEMKERFGLDPDL